MARREGKRPVLSIIQPSNSHTPNKGKDKLLPPLPFPSSSRSNSSPTRSTPRPIPIRATSSPSSLSHSHTSAPSPQPEPRRRPLSRRYTRPPSLLTSRSPLQSHSIPSFSHSHNHPQHAPNTTLFEELLMRNLERRFGERLNQFKSAGEKVQGLGGALKPGRELLIWSAVNRCKAPSPTREGTRGKGGVENWRESGLKKGGGHKRSHTLPDLRKASKKEEDDDDDDDEPLARQLEEVIKKRQEQYERIQVERVRKSFEEEKEKEEEKGRTETVKVKLPKSPERAKLKPLATTTRVETGGGGDTRVGKKTTTLSPTAQPFNPSSTLTSSSSFSPRWLPTLPERVATLSCSPSSSSMIGQLSTPPAISRSKSDSGLPLSPLPASSQRMDAIVVEGGKGDQGGNRARERGGKLKKRSRSENGLMGFSGMGTTGMGMRKGSEGILSF